MGAVPFHLDYFSSIPENVRARAHHMRDVRLRERRLARAQTLLHNLHFDGVERGNGSDSSLDGWVDEYFSFENLLVLSLAEIMLVV